MSTTATPAIVPPEQPSLSQAQRIINTYVAPSKTFQDIRRNASWWAPFILISICSLAFAFTLDTKIGFDHMVENQIKLSPKATERMQNLTPEQHQQAIARSSAFWKGLSYGSPVIVLLLAAITAGVLMAAFNFGLGAEVSYKQALAICLYSSVAADLLRSLLAIGTMAFTSDPDTFNIANPVGTNPAFYLNVLETPRWLYALLGSVDIFFLWYYFLLALGFSIVAKQPKSKALLVVAGWYLFVTLIFKVGPAALFS
jgi:hypothetical protein